MSTHTSNVSERNFGQHSLDSHRRPTERESPHENTDALPQVHFLWYRRKCT